MAGLYDKQAEVYVEARPEYPKEWYSKLADLTPKKCLAWDAGTGNGQAAIGIAEHYEQVIASDISEAQLKHAIQHSRVRYIHTPTSTSEDEMVNLIAGGHGNSVDLIIVAEAVHWFDLPHFYSLVKRLLRKPGGIIAVWGYNPYRMQISPDFDPVFKRFRESCVPFIHPNSKYVIEGYKTLSFPFESVGLGCEGEPVSLELPMEWSFPRVEKMLRSSSAVPKARDQGVDLLCEEVMQEFRAAWGALDVFRSFKYEAFMLAGKL